MSALLNKPLAPTKPKEAAPEVLSYRQRLYDRETLMLPNEPWNPAARLAQMRDNYDRLVLELGVSPRGGARGGARAGDSVQLPKVPQNRVWDQRGGGAPVTGSQSARKHGHRSRKGFSEGGSSTAAPLQTARMLQKVDHLADSGQLSAAQAKRLRKLWTLQEAVMSGSGDEDSLLAAFHSVLAYLEEPDAQSAPMADSATAAVPAAMQPQPPPSLPPPPQSLPPQPQPASQQPPPASSVGQGPGLPVERATGSSERQRSSRGSHASGASSADAEADAAFAKVEGLVASSYTKVFDFFRRMDSNLNGKISKEELHTGFYELGLDMTHEEVDAFFRRVEKHHPKGHETTLKALHKALRPGQSMKHMLKRPEDAARDAGGAILDGDLQTEGMSEQELAAARAEANLRAGRLPSLSPDEDDEGGGGKKLEKASTTAVNEYDYVWQQLQTRIAPDGPTKTPEWQKEAMHRARWRADLSRRQEIRQQKAAHKYANPLVPSWDRPARPSRRHLINSELRKMRHGAEAEEHEALGASAQPPTLAAATSSFGGSVASVGGHAPSASNDNAARRAIAGADPEDTSTAHLSFLRQSAITHDGHTTERANKMALYEQSLQQLQLQKQELDSGLEHAKLEIDRVQRSGKAAALDASNQQQRGRRDRLKEDLLEIQRKANAMHSSTQSLMHVINSLRITRKRHVQRVRGLDAKEKQMDSDAQFLLGSASTAMEERERLRAKHERLRHESAALRNMQLREAAALDEQLGELDGQHRELDGMLQELEEHEKRVTYRRQQRSYLDAEKCELKYGFLKGQLDGWAAEFERVTAITGVRFGEGKSDAVDKVVSIYSANELRNKSLFQFVTEDVVGQTETLAVEVAELERLAESLEREQASADAADDAAATAVSAAAAAASAFETQLEQASGIVDKLLPMVEQVGSTMDVPLPQHLQGKPLAPPLVPEFLALLEDRLHEILHSASSIVAANTPPPPEESEDSVAGTPTKPAADESEEVSRSLQVLKELTKPRVLETSKLGTQILHNDSSERLLPM